VLDVGIGESMRDAKIIEINPFGKIASAGLFSWVIDKKVLLNREIENVEIRI
jgi:hypothetical protein